MSAKDSLHLLGIIFIVFILLACTHSGNNSKSSDPSGKIQFDLSQLNDEGLYGPPYGLRGLSYEFCIPADEHFVSEVQSIDSTLSIQSDSKGGIGCSESEYLCVGNSHQKNYRQVLLRLAGLEYVEKIEQSFFEN